MAPYELARPDQNLLELRVVAGNETTAVGLFLTSAKAYACYKLHGTVALQRARLRERDSDSRRAAWKKLNQTYGILPGSNSGSSHLAGPLSPIHGDIIETEGYQVRLLQSDASISPVPWTGHVRYCEGVQALDCSRSTSVPSRFRFNEFLVTGTNSLVERISLAKRIN